MTKSKYEINEEGRECVGCEKFHPWDQYHKHVTGSHGRNSHCKKCRRDMSIERTKDKIKTDRKSPKVTPLQQLTPKSWDADGAAAFLSRK
jgi:hypothetical protein